MFPVLLWLSAYLRLRKLTYLLACLLFSSRWRSGTCRMCPVRCWWAEWYRDRGLNWQPGRRAGSAETSDSELHQLHISCLTARRCTHHTDVVCFVIDERVLDAKIAIFPSVPLTRMRYVVLTRGQSNLTKSASRAAHSPVRGHLRGSKVVPLNSWGRVSYQCSIISTVFGE